MRAFAIRELRMAPMEVPLVSRGTFASARKFSAFFRKTGHRARCGLYGFEGAGLYEVLVFGRMACRCCASSPAAGWTALFSGHIGTVEGGRHAKSLQVRSDTELLDALVPRHVYLPGSLNTMYDDTCGVQRQAHRSTGTATGGASRTSFNHNQAPPVDHWTLGDITMTSGANAGIARTVRSNTAQGVSVIVPWLFPVNAGDTFAVQLGCDGSQGMCSARFGNLGRYRGMRFIPVAEMVT
jgi:uncharacterized phage protein (TIGR02218 family)